MGQSVLPLTFTPDAIGTYGYYQHAEILYQQDWIQELRLDEKAKIVLNALCLETLDACVAWCI